MSQINERGTKKWVSLMMPEHIKLLNDMWEEKEYKKKPILDEQQLIEIDMKLQCAIHNDLTVKIKYFEDHNYQTKRGKLLDISSLKKALQLDDNTEIAWESIIDVYID